MTLGPRSDIVLCLILDSRQNERVAWYDRQAIVLCLILDSRQNLPVASVWPCIIVLCLILDSRQNYNELNEALEELYCALFWIQGKTTTP